MAKFISELRYRVSRLFPERTKFWLTRQLPWFVDFTALFFQGIDLAWWRDPEFKALYREVGPRSILDRKRAWIIHNLVKATNGLPGHIAEIGVYKGGGAKLMLSSRRQERHFYGFDTFSGLPKTDGERDPYWTAGDMGDTAMEDVQHFLGAEGVTLISGIFPQSAAELSSDIRFSLVHIDVDIYASTRDALEWIYERMAPSGIILLDDYGFLSCPGVRRATDDFFADKSVHPVYLPTGQCMIMMNASVL